MYVERRFYLVCTVKELLVSQINMNYVFQRRYEENILPKMKTFVFFALLRQNLNNNLKKTFYFLL